MLHIIACLLQYITRNIITNIIMHTTATCTLTITFLMIILETLTMSLIAYWTEKWIHYYNFVLYIFTKPAFLCEQFIFFWQSWYYYMHLTIQYYVLQSIKAKAKALCICKLNVVFYDYYSRHYLHIYIYILLLVCYIIAWNINITIIIYPTATYNITNGRLLHNLYAGVYFAIYFNYYLQCSILWLLF